MDYETAYWISSHLDWLVYPKPANELSGDEINMLEALEPYEVTTVANECEGLSLFGMRSKSYTLVSGKRDGRNAFIVSGAELDDVRIGIFVI